MSFFVLFWVLLFLQIIYRLFFQFLIFFSKIHLDPQSQDLDQPQNNYYKSTSILAMNISFDEIKEVKSFDVIFVGHLASVAAHLFASITKDQYTCLVLKQQKTIVEPSLAPLHLDEIKVTKKIKHISVQTKQLKIMGIKPISKQIEVEGGKTYDYKYLVYSGNIDEWTDYSLIQTLTEALSNQYSLVYSNIKKRNLTSACKQVSSGNVVFYVPKGSHSGFDNFNFLTVIQQIMENSKINSNQVKPLSFKIILQGTDFFPHCKEADNIMKKEVRQRSIEVFYNSQLTKIDYLRRTLTINDKNELPYNFLYCVVPHKVPTILSASQIDPYQNNPRTLQNRKYKNIFIYGADIFPTTHTFESVQYQAHHIAKNLDHLLSKTGQISIYNGYTRIPIFLSTKQVVDVVHYYSKREQCDLQEQFQPVIRQSCTWFAMLMGKFTKSYIAQSYYNYKSYGAPYYIFAPALTSVPLIQEEKHIDYSEPLGLIKSKGIDKNQKIIDEDMLRMNRTAERPKNGTKMLRN